MLGLGDTVSVTMEDMIHHGAAVARGAKNALVVVDMPFMSYQSSVYDAVVNAGRLMKEARANAVKLEGGVEVADRIRAIVDCQIPVCAHIGLTPQGINALGGFKVQGKTADSARKLLEDAHAVEEAGAFAVVLEAIPAELAERVSAELTIPTIGIGAARLRRPSAREPGACSACSTTSRRSSCAASPRWATSCSRPTAPTTPP